jgi:hypothetical protein
MVLEDGFGAARLLLPPHRYKHFSKLAEKPLPASRLSRRVSCDFAARDLK